MRSYNKDSLQKLIENHKPQFPKVDYHVVDGAKVDKLLQQCNNSSTGPDGIPFALYRVTSEQLCDMWCELIQRAGKSMDFPESFGESQLVLLPKIENIPCFNQFRPISITNSDYWIVMRYWAKWLMESAREVISLEQNAIFAGRSIDNAVELIHDGFMEAVAEGKDVTILQTDFCKAYDYVNHEALMELLIGLNAPPLSESWCELISCCAN